MKTVLKAQLSQSLNLTPQLLQSIRLLQLDALQLEQEIARALETNPLLEREDDAAEVAHAESDVLVEDMGLHDWVGDTGPRQQAAQGGGDEDAMARIAGTDTRDLRQRLIDGLALEHARPAELALAAGLLDHTDDSGYLEQPVEAIAAAIGADAGELEVIRQRLLRCEPVGVCARDLRECLLVQLREMPGRVPGRALAQRLVADHLDLLASHDPDRLARALGVDPAQAVEAERLVMSLDPRPGHAHDAPAAAVVPDVLVRQDAQGRWVVALNPDTAPKVRINPWYEKVLAESGDAPVSAGMRDMLVQARWLTRGLSMRYDTLLRATQAIVERQQAFLAEGEHAMAPLNLKEIAEAIGMHESTISRISTGKFMQTPRGTFELKYFFAVRLDGAEVAGSAVRAMVKRLIDGENPATPLADDTIAVLLARDGVRIARRTVAKYRDQLRIPSAKERRKVHTSRQRFAIAS